MSFTKAELDEFEHRLAPWWIPVSSTATAGGTNYVADTYLFQDTGGFNLSPQETAGIWAYRPTAAADADRERRSGDNSGTILDVSNGRIYIAQPNYTNNISAGVIYSLHSIQPRITFDILLATMHRLQAPFYSPLEKFTNANASSATGWSVSGAGSVAVNTTAANVMTGSSSLFFNAGTAGEYLKGTTFRVTPNTNYFVSANYRVDAGGPVYLALWDETNNVEIQGAGRVSHSREQFVVMQRTFTTPATCEEASVRIYVTNASDDVYVDYVSGPWNPNDKIIDLPSWANRANAVRKVRTASYYEGSSTGGYSASSRIYSDPLQLRRDYGVRIDHASANPFKLELSRNARLPDSEVWIEGIRPASDFVTWLFTAAGQDTTCNLPIEVVGYSWLRDVAEYALSNDPEDTQAAASLDLLLGKEIGGQRSGGLLTVAMHDYLSDLDTVTSYVVSEGWGRRGF